MWEPVVETRDSSREESRKEAIDQIMTVRTNWSYQTLSKPHRKKNTVEVIDSNNCFECTKNKHFRKRNPTFNKYHWKTKISRVDEGRERNQIWKNLCSKCKVHSGKLNKTLKVNLGEMTTNDKKYKWESGIFLIDTDR